MSPTELRLLKRSTSDLMYAIDEAIKSNVPGGGLMAHGRAGSWDRLGASVAAHVQVLTDLGYIDDPSAKAVETVQDAPD